MSSIFRPGHRSLLTALLWLTLVFAVLTLASVVLQGMEEGSEWVLGGSAGQPIEPAASQDSDGDLPGLLSVRPTLVLAGYWPAAGLHAAQPTLPVSHAHCEVRAPPFS